MDLRQLMEDSKMGVAIDNRDDGGNNPPKDSATALQLFLDHIPISSIPGINNSSTVLEFTMEDCLREAIRLMNEKNVFGAPITDIFDTANDTQRFLDKYIGFIDFPSMVLWSLEECKETHTQIKDESGNGFFSMLEQNPHIAQTKIGELAKSFLWDPFFPIHLEDTLFHVMLLFSKHRLQFVPVIDQSRSNVMGFVSQHAVMQVLLQSSGLEWFDNIAEKSLSEFRHEEQVVQVYGDQCITDALHILWENRIGVVAVIERETKRLIGCVRNSDLHLIVDNEDLFSNRMDLPVEKFIHMDASNVNFDSTIERDLGALLSAGTPTLRNNFLPRMDSPITNRKTDTLKQAMKNLAETKCSFSFIVDESWQMKGLLTLRDIITHFFPPCVDSRIRGGGSSRLH